MGNWDTYDDNSVEEVKKEIETKDGEKKLPDWYKPYMLNKVGWLDGVPQKPASIKDFYRGSIYDGTTSNKGDRRKE